MNSETMKQIMRHVVQEAIAGNLDPFASHPGLEGVLPTLEHIVTNARDRKVQIQLQFTSGEWIATIQRMSYVAENLMFGHIPPGQQVNREMITFNRFDGNTIVEQYSQVDMSGNSDSGNSQSKRHQFVQTGDASLSPDDACALIRHLIEESVKGKFDLLEEHPAFKDMIPTIEARRAGSSKVEVSFPVEFSDGEWVATRSYWKQTAKGELFGVDATGRELEFEVLMVHRIEDGKVVDARTIADVMAMMSQLGIEV